MNNGVAKPPQGADALHTAVIDLANLAYQHGRKELPPWPEQWQKLEARILALAAPPQGASSLLPADDVDALIGAAMEVIGQHDFWARQMPAGEFDDPLANAITKLHKATETVGIARDIAAASPLPAPQEPALTPAIAVALVADALRRGGDKRLAMVVENLALSLFAAPAPVDPESQGAPYTQLMSDSVTVNPISATQPASPARELTNVEIVTLGKDAFGIDPTFDGSLMKFARAVIARDRALREQGR